MPKKTQKYDFLYGECYDYDIFPVRNIHLAESKPGIYAWYLRLLPSDKTIDIQLAYSRIFNSKRFSATLKGNLGESYSGILGQNFEHSLDNRVSEETVFAASVIFSPPIYIGISKGIKNRLQSHFRAIEQALNNDPSSTITDSGEKTYAIDSEEESGVFGQRIAKLLAENNFRSPEGLFIKVIYNDNIPFADIKAAEFILNRAYLPICGLR